jgi:hypothetical protein
MSSEFENQLRRIREEALSREAERVEHERIAREAKETYSQREERLNKEKERLFQELTPMMTKLMTDLGHTVWGDRELIFSRLYPVYPDYPARRRERRWFVGVITNSEDVRESNAKPVGEYYEFILERYGLIGEYPGFSDGMSHFERKRDKFLENNRGDELRIIIPDANAPQALIVNMPNIKNHKQRGISAEEPFNRATLSRLVQISAGLMPRKFSPPGLVYPPPDLKPSRNEPLGHGPGSQFW